MQRKRDPTLLESRVFALITDTLFLIHLDFFSGIPLFYFFNGLASEMQLKEKTTETNTLLSYEPFPTLFLRRLLKANDDSFEER